MKEYKVIVPLNDTWILKQLNVGDRLLLSGEIYVFRDQVHKKIHNGELPDTLKINFHNSAVYYCAATPPKNNFVIGSCGPTSAYRMDEYTETVLSIGFRIMIGKGYRSSKVVELCKKFAAIYAITYGGCGALLNKYVKNYELVAFSDLGPEAMYKFYVSDFPSIVAIDTNGNKIWTVET
ncbi:MAG: FumA C-terminus/TtdB family hydratase beta subunit [Endomicrobia bacterium]|nr:FumA C-terminus/TtdB family hydratase beta subunit [Endomicrobiia bacterium]MDW8055510.1 FumA C-terminus/TtdB family hydratase beta subunit [Elusimicrobiota bacterium]